MTTLDGLKGFIKDLDATWVEAPEDGLFLERAAPLLQRLLADMSWLPPEYTRSLRVGEVQYLLSAHPAGGYTVTSVVHSPGYRTPVHDHGTWGLVGIWRGEEQEERFQRIDDRTSPDPGRLRPASQIVHGPGSVSHLEFPDDEIHRIRNLSPYASCSIYVYGGALHRHGYDLTTGAITEWPSAAVRLDKQEPV